MLHRLSFLLVAATVALGSSAAGAAENRLRLATFQCDVTPPPGAPLCDALVEPAREIVDRLHACGIVLLGAERPVVLCAVDWVGVGNSGYDRFREELAVAAGTTPDRVALHCLHQHDAPGCDFAANELLAPFGLENKLFDAGFALDAMKRTAAALTAALSTQQAITHVGFGHGRVEQVASTRRVLGADGKVKFVRYTSCKDPAVRAEPEGLIDPAVQLVSFWNGETPLVSITYYATHPQSYYGAGGVSDDFPGMARRLREADLPAVAHIHFNGAGGNVTAGKYNDGAPENRPVLAQRLAAGMKLAWESTTKHAVQPADVEWRMRPVALPLARPLEDVAALKATLANDKADLRERLRAARNLAWALRCQSGRKIDLTCLKVGPGYLVHMPGELFVEYQLAAQKMRPGQPVCMAAYGDYAPGYIGTAIAYTQGGYETGPVSRVAPEVEAVLIAALRELLK